MRWARLVEGLLVAGLVWVSVGPSVAVGAPASVVPTAAHPAAAHPAAVLPAPIVGAPADLGPAWSWPVPSPPIVAAYVAPTTAYSAGHRGIDLGVAEGVAVSAPDDAVVRFSGVVVDRPVLTLDHGGGVLSSYEPVESSIPVGTPVARGAVIGSVASGGHCDGGCLHFGVRIDGQYVSPLLFFGRVPPAVLLPMGRG